MLRTLVFLLCLLSTACLPFKEAKRPVTRSEASRNFELVLNATAALITADGRSFCAGVFHKNVLITAEHCVDDGFEFDVAVYRDSGKTHNSWTRTWKYYKFASDEATDVALLRPSVPTPLGNHVNLMLAPDIHIGERVFTVGHPLGLPHMITEGRLALPGWKVDGALYTIVSSQVAPGNSGGPCVNDDGQIIGIVSFYWYAQNHLAGIAHLDNVRALLEESGAI